MFSQSIRLQTTVCSVAIQAVHPVHYAKTDIYKNYLTKQRSTHAGDLPRLRDILGTYLLQHKSQTREVHRSGKPQNLLHPKIGSSERKKLVFPDARCSYCSSRATQSSPNGNTNRTKLSNRHKSSRLKSRFASLRNDYVRPNNSKRAYCIHLRYENSFRSSCVLIR